MADKLDPLRVIEAGYEWVDDDATWLANLARAVAPFGIGTGVAVYLVDLASAPRVTALAAHGLPDGYDRQLRTFTAGLDRKVAAEIYAPTEFVGNASWRIRRLARARNVSVDRLVRGNHVQAWALIGGDPRERAIAIAFPSDRPELTPETPFPRARVLGLAAAHLGAALRLRALAAPDPDDTDVTESVLDPRGKVLHATGPATGARARESLVEAVVRREKARGRLRRVDADEAASLWAVLVSGRWSIVDFVDRDGKRLMLARKNPIGGPDVAALSEDERDVLWLATQGHSRKYIAYELGVSVAQVGRRLTSAMRKLRVDSRRELVRRFAGG